MKFFALFAIGYLLGRFHAWLFAIKMCERCGTYCENAKYGGGRLFVSCGRPSGRRPDAR